MSRMRFLPALFFTACFVLLSAESTSAQGIRPFSTQAPAPNTSIDLANSNIVFSFPIRSKIGAIPFQYSLIENFPPNPASPYGYETVGIAGTMIGAGSPVMANYGQTQNYNCGPRGSGDYYTRLSYWYVLDSTGANHPVNTGDSIYVSQFTGSGCQNSGSFSVMTTDGSGYTLNVTAGASGSGDWTATVTDVSGNTVLANTMYPNSTRYVEDPDGNNITFPAGSNYSYTDTLGQSVLTVQPLANTYTYTDQNSNDQTYTVGYTSEHWKTNFSGTNYCAVNTDQSGIKMPTSITQNTTGQQWLITYEPTPGYSGDVTGRIQQVTFPSGGYIKYTYSGGSNGLNCNTGVIPTITKTAYDANGNTSTWAYVNNYNQTGTETSPFTVTETDPAGNQTVYTFWGQYQLEAQSYQGTTASGTLLRTNVTCYNGNFSSCTATNPATSSSYVSQTDVFTYPQGTTSASLVETKYNSSGTVAEVKKYDFGAATALPPAGAPGTTPISDTTVSYDSGGACGNLTSPIYDRPCSVTTSGSSGVVSQTNYTYNSTGHPTQTSNLVSGSTYLTSSAAYNANGTIASSTDVNGNTTTYGYNGSGGCNGLLLTSTSASGLSTSRTWDCNGGVPTSATDANSQTTSYGYQTSGGTADPFWRLLSVTDPLGNATRTTYSESAPFTQETSLQFNGGASGSDVLTTFDGLNRPIFVQTRQAPGSSTFDSVQTTYGWTSNTGPFTTTSVPYAGAQGQAAPGGTAVTKNQLDAIARPSTVVDGSGGTVAYSYTSRDLLMTVGPAPSGENTKRRQLEYDGLGRMTSVCELTAGTSGWSGGTCAQSSSQTGYWTKYTYDPLGDLLTVTENAQSSGNQQTRTYAFDDLQRLTSEANPETAQTAVTYTYDTDSTCTPTSKGDLVKRIDAAGNTSCFTYDSLHRLTGVTYPSGPYAASTPTKTLVYDSATVNGQAMQYAKGHLANAYTGASNSRTTDLGFSYTARGETSDVYEATPHSGGYYHVNQTYWANGVPNQLSNLPSLPTIARGVDGEGRVNQVTASTGQNPVNGVTYNNASLATLVTLGSGDSDSFTYDPNTLRMTQYKFTIGATPQSLIGGLTWNANATLNQMTIADPFNSADAQTCNYAHDDLTRLVTASCGSAAGQTFTYDPFGNIDKSGSPYSFLPTYSTATNRITSMSGITPTYDANGYLTNDSVHLYSWDSNGGAISVDGVTATYDALGRRVEQNQSGTYSEVVYDPAGGKLALMSGQTLQKAFVGLPGQATAVYTGSGLNHYRHSDWLGSTRLTSSPSQTVLFTGAYAPFGEPYAQSGTADSSFTGQNQDTASGIYDFPAREYSMQGRWPSPDPSGVASVNPSNPQSWNRYAYVWNSPLSNIDPSGMECVWDDGSYDAADDSETKSPDRCTAVGGTWVDPTLFESVEGSQYGSWSGQASPSTAFDWLTSSATVYGGPNAAQQETAEITAAFLVGWGPRNVEYLPQDPFTLSFQKSAGMDAINASIKAGCSDINGPIRPQSGSVSVGTSEAAKNTFIDGILGGEGFLTPEAQLGAFNATWARDGGTVSITVTNPISLNSLFYHLPAKLGISNPSNGPMGTINQTLHVEEPDPCS